MAIPLPSASREPLDLWAEAVVRLPASTPRPGRLALANWQREILRDYQRSDTRQVTLAMSSQIGKSLLLLLVAGYHMHRAPSAIFLVQATLATLRRFIREKLEPLVLETPALRSRVRLTSHQRLPFGEVPFQGGTLYTGWAGSAASLRSVTAPVALGDEVDAWAAHGSQLDADSPVDMLRQRLAAFGDRGKLVVASTPTTEEGSLIWHELGAGSDARWVVRCLHCRDEHALEWEQVKGGRLHCPACGVEVTELDRGRMLDAGRWRHAHPERARHRSYHASQLMSMLTTVAATVTSSETMLPRAFRTQVLGLPYRSIIMAAPDPGALDHLYQTEGPKLPAAITAAVDVQRDRLELQVVEWDGLNPHVASHAVLPLMAGDSEAQLWRRLDRELRQAKPDLIYIDRGYRPDDVRRLSETHLRAWVVNKRVRFCKGLSRPSFEDDLNVKRSTLAHPWDVSLAVDTAKVMVYEAINAATLTVQAGAVPVDFMRQLVSEELKMVARGMKEVPKWELPSGRRNEALDCMAYNLCARYALGMTYDRNAAGWDEFLAMQRRVHG